MSSLTTGIDAGEPVHGEPPHPLLLRALSDPATYGAGGDEVAVHETHASVVFVCGPRAYKIKKAVSLGFLDYGTLARRHAACREEVRVNSELAPGVYLGVRAIVATARGLQLAPEDTPGAIEYAVEMRSFREADTLAGLIEGGVLRSEHLRAVARRLAAFHRLTPGVAGGAPADVLAMWQANVRALADLAASLAGGWEVQLAVGFGEAFVRAHAGELERRRKEGLVRDGHGDLRCEHVLAVPEVRIVDRVEFDPALRHTDIACDLAFLTMDLEAQGQRWAARELAGAYRREGMDPGSEELLAFYAAHRALVRAKVALVTAAERDGEARARQLARARTLWDLGERLCWRARAPLALVICGPAASGKSTLAGELARRSGLHVASSDELRKSAAGLARAERAAPEHYSAQATRNTYERLGQQAGRLLERERGVIVDATCRSRAHRALLFRRLEREGLTRLVVRCEVPLEVALERAASRMRAASVSDATPQVVAEQNRSYEALEELPAETVLTLDAQRSLEDQVAEVTGAVDRLLAHHTPPDSGQSADAADAPAAEHLTR
ncbi:MAG TPA: AAA family ATPase [Solirubrobacteraceae bacterium]|nr:AAA family ATPase [Solirubrobacteraceae bacterium]